VVEGDSPSFFDPLRHEMDRLYDRLFDWTPLYRFSEEGEWLPSLDVSETSKEIVVKAELPRPGGERH